MHDVVSGVSSFRSEIPFVKSPTILTSEFHIIIVLFQKVKTEDFVRVYNLTTRDDSALPDQELCLTGPKKLS